MKAISRDEVQQILRRDGAAGGRGDSRITTAVQSSDFQWFTVSLSDEESFFSLTWHDVPRSRILSTESLGLRDVARRLLHHGWTFDSLADQTNLSTLRRFGDYEPSYFAECAAIDRSFDFDLFTPPILVLPNADEQHRNPIGIFYLMDGTHRTLVLAKKLLLNELPYQPIQALLLSPRPRH